MSASTIPVVVRHPDDPPGTQILNPPLFAQPRVDTFRINWDRTYYSNPGDTLSPSGTRPVRYVMINGRPCETNVDYWFDRAGAPHRVGKAFRAWQRLRRIRLNFDPVVNR